MWSIHKTEKTVRFDKKGKERPFMLKLILTVLRDILWEIAIGLIQTRATA